MSAVLLPPPRSFTTPVQPGVAPGSGPGYPRTVSFVLAWIASLFEVESTLAQRIAAGDEAALRRLYDRLAPRVRAVALRVLGAAGDADDVVQETFLDVWNRAGTFDPDRGSLVSWVTTIGHRRAVDRLRRRGTRPGPGDGDAAMARAPSADATPHESAEERQARERIVAALASLPPEQREAIELMYFRGMSQSEAADHTGAALGTFKSRVRAAMARLSGLLDELAPEVRT